MNIRDFKDKLFVKAKEHGFSAYEIYFSEGSSFEVRVFGGEISQYKNAISKGVSFRGVFNGKMGYSYSEKIDETVIEILIKNAAENAQIIEDNDVEELYAGESTYENMENYIEDNVMPELKISKAIEMEEIAYSLDKRVKSVDYSVIGTAKGQTSIINSKGLDLTHKTSFSYAFLDARLEENGRTKMGEEIWFDNDFNKFSPEDLAKKAINKGLSYLGASPIPSKTYSVIFDNNMTKTLFSTYASAFFGENVQKGFSLLKGKIGGKVANEIVTIRDDGLLIGSIGSLPFDSEGVSTKNTTIIENGLLKTYLHNLKSAKKDGIKSTGNGFKHGIAGSITTGCTNFYIVPTNKPFSEMVKKMDNGVIITELAGMHSGCNIISGDFSLSAEGFFVEGGKIVKPLEQITVAGNFFELLMNISEVGGDLKFGFPSPSGTFSMPSIMVKELNISGV